MMQLCKRKSLAVLMVVCLLTGMMNTLAYAQGGAMATDREKETLLQSFSTEESEDDSKGAASGSALFASEAALFTSDSVIYVGGTEESGDGSSIAPYLTLKEAADAIYAKEAGSYKIVMLGDTKESEPITFGNGYTTYDISISVSGSTAYVRKEHTMGHLITVSYNTTLSLEGSSDTEQLLFDGGGEAYQGGYSLFKVNYGGSLVLKSYAGIQNNGVDKYADGTNGAGVYNEGTFRMEGGVIAGNSGLNLGSAIYNYYSGNIIINGGIITQNLKGCLYNAGTVTMNDGNITGNIGDYVLWNGSGSFEMKGGVIAANRNEEGVSYYTPFHIGGGEFKLSGGTIENHSTSSVIALVCGSFFMSGGTICNNTASSGVVRVSDESSFSMSGGLITNNTGDAILMQGPVTLSGNASLLGKDGDIATITMEFSDDDYPIVVSGSLSNLTSIKIELSELREGKQILIGSLTEELISKFEINDVNYSLDLTGKLVYTGEPLTLYVDKDGNNSNSGTSSLEPLATLNEAIERIGTGVGTIIVQSDIDITEPIFIITDITIKSDGNTWDIYTKIYDEDAYFVFFAYAGKLSLGDENHTEGKLVFNNFNKPTYSSLENYICLRGDSTLNLYKGAEIKYNNFSNGFIYNDNSTVNLYGGDITENNLTAINNVSGGIVNLFDGKISASRMYHDEGSIGIYNDAHSKVTMYGGYISDYLAEDSAAILNEGELVIWGGAIFDYYHGIINTGELILQGDVTFRNYLSITTNKSAIYLLEEGRITLGRGLLMDKEKKILLLLDESYTYGDYVLRGYGDDIKNNYDNFIFEDSNYGISETGQLIYIGEVPEYYVDANYIGGDSDGSIEKPFTNLENALGAICDSVKVGVIYICSDLEIKSPISLSGAKISIVNYGEEAHTITHSSPYYMFMIYYGGTLTLGREGEGNDEAPSLLLMGTEQEVKRAFFEINENAILNLYSGVKMYDNVGPGNYGAGAVDNKGEFYMYGGVIEGNTGNYSGGVVNQGTFMMYGGSIRNCAGDKGGAVYNETGTFVMRGGTIEDNSSDKGIGIYNLATLRILDDASIPEGVGESNKIGLDNNSFITLDGDLQESSSILLTTTGLPGKRLLSGDSNILLDNYTKFKLDSSLASYRLKSDGTLEFLGEQSNFYVDGENGSDSNVGTREEPFASLHKAIAAIDEGTGVGTIHICSDLVLDKPIVIHGAITLMHDGGPHEILRSSDFDEELDIDIPDSYYITPSMFIVLGRLELGSSELDESTEASLLIIDGNKEQIQSWGAIISNYGELILHNGIALQNNESYLNGGGIYNNGSLLMMGGVIQNNMTGDMGGGIFNDKATATILGGSIRNNEAYYGGGIGSSESTITIFGGSIQNNKANTYGGGISTQDTTITISGGSINENQADYGAGIALYNSSKGTMSGGVISGNSGEEGSDILGKGIIIDATSEFTILQEATITNGDDVVLVAEDYGSPVITVGGSLSEETPNIKLHRVFFNWLEGRYDTYYNVGDQILLPGEGYTLTARDIAKFELSDRNYAINSLGCITSGMNPDWFTFTGAETLYYTGEEIRPTISGKHGKTSLVQGTDYQVSYQDNINPGTATIIIEGLGKYNGRATKSFTIHKAVIDRILTSPPADRTVSAAENMGFNQLIESIPLLSADVQWIHGTEYNLPITWSLAEGTFDLKGGIYTFEGIFGTHAFLETEGVKLTARITVTPFVLSKPSFEDTTIITGIDTALTADKLGDAILPTGGILQVGENSIPYTIAWDSSTLDGSTVGASNTFSGIITYIDAPAWATLPVDRTVSRKVSVVEPDTYTITATAGSNGSITPEGNISVNRSSDQSFAFAPVAGYTIFNVNVDGIDIGAVESYTFRNVNENHTIRVTFKEIEESTTPTPTPTTAPGPTTIPGQIPGPIPGQGDNPTSITPSPVISPTPSGDTATRKVFQVGSEEDIELMHQGDVSGITLEVRIPDSLLNDTNADYTIQLDAEILRMAKETETELHISVRDEEGIERYSWSFAGEDLAASDNDITDMDLSLQVEKLENHQEVTELMSQRDQGDRNQENGLIITFSHHGSLPAQASVRVFVGNMGYSEGDKLYLYYYNTETGNLETLPYSTNYTVDSQGYITVNITHCSTYVLLPDQAKGEIITSLREQISVTPDTVALYHGSDKYAKAKINIKLPETLEVVKNLKDKTSGSAIGAVTISYQSSDKKIVSVDSTGNITAKKPGKATIKVTATLYSGKSKTFKIPVTVEKPYIVPIKRKAEMKVGESFTFTAKAYGLEDKKIEWKTTKKSIVTINKKTGKATAVKKGTDYVVVSIDNVTYKMKVIVK